MSNYSELNVESKVLLNPISEIQSVAMFLLMNKDSIKCRIENEAGDALTEVMSFDQYSSFMFRVSSEGTYVMMLRGNQASFNVSMLTYDRE